MIFLGHFRVRNCWFVLLKAMVPSPIAHYYIRKLLKQSIANLDHLFVTDEDHAGLSDESLDRILHDLFLTSERCNLRVQELERLANFYQQLERTPGSEVALIEVKRRILKIMGFQADIVFSAQFPFMVEESKLRTFRFFHQNQIQDGMCYENELYAAVHCFDLTHRLKAYQIAWVLSEAKVPMILSLSTHRLIIWINLQSPTYLVLVRQDAGLLKIVLLLSSALRKGKVIVSSEKRLKINYSTPSQPLHKKIVTEPPKTIANADRKDIVQGEFL